MPSVKSSTKVVSSSTLEIVGKTGNRVASKRIKIYAVKNSGDDTVTKLTPVADLS